MINHKSIFPKLYIFLFTIIFTHTLSSQIKNNVFYEYETPRNEYVLVKIDTTLYKPNKTGGFLYNLRNEKKDVSVFLDKKSLSINDTIKQFQKMRKEGEVTDYGIVNGVKSMTMKMNKNENYKGYTVFHYMKFILPNQLLLFTVISPENDFEKNKEEFIEYGKSMMLKP